MVERPIYWVGSGHSMIPVAALTYAGAELPLEPGELRPHHLLIVKASWHRVQAVQRCYRWAWREMGLLEGSPFAGMKKPRLSKLAGASD